MPELPSLWESGDSTLPRLTPASCLPVRKHHMAHGEGQGSEVLTLLGAQRQVSGGQGSG